MKFSQRLAMAWRMLIGAKAGTQTAMVWELGQPSYPEIKYENMVKHGYRRNELIYACINKTANTSAQVEMKVYREGSDEEVPNHPLKKLIQQPNPFASEFDLWASISSYQKLAGRAIYEKERSNAGKVVRLWPLRPDWIFPIPSETNMISGYAYQPKGITERVLDVKDVVDFKLWDPLNFYQSWPPVAVAARVGDSDNAATDHIKRIWEKGGVPTGLLTSKQLLSDTQVDVIRQRWHERYGGAENWLEPVVLDADAQYQRMSFSFSELGFDILDARSEARICAVLDIPPILVGAKVGLDRATYSNYEEARKAWWEDSLIPMYESLLDVVINQLLPEFGTGYYVKWDFSKVKALQEEQNKRWQRATTALQAGGITVNEFRAEVGLPDQGTAGEIYLRGMATVEVPAKSGVRPALPAPGKSTKAQGTDDEEIRVKHEKAIGKGMRTFFDEQLGRIEQELKKSAAKEQPRAKADNGLLGLDVSARIVGNGFGTVLIGKEPEQKLITSDIFDVAWWLADDDRLYKWLLPMIHAAGLAGAESALNYLMDMGIGLDWAIINQEALKWAQTYTFPLVKGINETTKNMLQTALSDWIQSGAPLDTLIEQLTPTFGPVRADMIGVTETTRSLANGNVIAWQESGVVDGYTVTTAVDELVCPICGVYAPGGEDFDKVFPLDDAGHIPPFHVRCRCGNKPFVKV